MADGTRAKDLYALLEQVLDLPPRVRRLVIEFNAGNSRFPQVTIERFEVAPDGGYVVDGDAVRAIREQFQLRPVMPGEVRDAGESPT